MPSLISRLFRRESAKPQAQPRMTREQFVHLAESTGLVPLLGGLMAGLPLARRGGQDAPQILNEVQLQQYRAIARWAYEHNEYYGGLIDNGLINYECGVHGYEWKTGIRGVTIMPDQVPAPVKHADDCLEKFRQNDGWWDRTSEESRRVYRDGESFSRLFAPSSLSGNAQLRFVEPEHIIAPWIKNGTQEWRFGVMAELHDQERHLAYYVKADPMRPGEVVRAAGVDWEDIPREYLVGLVPGAGVIVHRKNYRSDRTIKRGLPLLWGGSDGLEQAETLIDNLTSVAAYLSTISHYRQHAPGVSSSALVDFQKQIKDQQTANGTTTGLGGITPYYAGFGSWLQPYLGNRADLTNFELATGPQVIDITNGMEMVPPPVQGNIIGFLAVLQARIRAACVLTGVPEFLASADPSNQNYASIKEAGSPFVTATQRRQQHKATKEKLIAETILIYEGADFPGMELTITPPPVAMKTDLETAQIQEIKIRSGTLSRQEAIRQDGRKPEITFADVKAYDEQFPDESGVMLMIDGQDASGGGQGGKQSGGLKPSPNGNGHAEEHYNRLNGLWEKKDAKGHEHKGSGPGGGQFSKSGGGNGAKNGTAITKKKQSDNDTKPHPGSTHKSTVTVKPSKQRAFDGKNPVDTKVTLTKQETGRVGEAIGIAYLKQIGYEDAKPMDASITNFPIDLIEDHRPTEVKAGLCSNTRGAQQWRLTFSKESAQEKADYEKMNSVEKSEWNSAKQDRIHQRKMAAIKELQKNNPGKKIQPRTMTMVINPDTRTADIYFFDGFHDRIDWQSPMAKEGYKGSVTYG